MKSVFTNVLFFFIFTNLCLIAQAQSNPQPASQQPGAMQQPPAPQQGTMQQQAPMQQAPAGQPPATMPPQNAPAGQQPPPGAAPVQGSNVAQTLQVYAYPKANQTPDKQAKDESRCFQWAQGQSAPQQQDAQQSQAQEKAEEQQQQQQAQQTQATDNVKRAYSACMESRNYTVK